VRWKIFPLWSSRSVSRANNEQWLRRLANGASHRHGICKLVSLEVLLFCAAILRQRYPDIRFLAPATLFRRSSPRHFQSALDSLSLCPMIDHPSLALRPFLYTELWILLLRGAWLL